MRFKLIMALVDDNHTNTIVDAARDAGATGCTIITSARGEGLTPEKSFMGLDLSGQRDLLLFLVAEQKSREILEHIAWPENLTRSMALASRFKSTSKTRLA